MWWSVGDLGGFGIGPLGTRRCVGGTCTNESLAWVGGSERWLRSATAAAAAGVIGMIAVLIVASAVAAKRTPRLAARGCIAAMLTAVLAGSYFVLAFPGVEHTTLSRGAYLYFVAALLGVIAAILVLRVRDQETRTTKPAATA